ncbi:tensin-3-like [Stigmatopora nigra]
MKVATPPPSVLHQSRKVGDASNELVRHFLVECTQKGVCLKGCPDEPFFGSLTALVCQHSITPLALPCKLILPDRACNVWYLGSVDLESLTGHQAVQKATTVTLTTDPPLASTVVHFKVSAQGITLTDNQRKLFFRRHYAVNAVIFCSLDPQGRRWTRSSNSNAMIFGFVARKSQTETENICHLFAENDPEQPASAIVNFVSKVMIGSYKK